MPGSFCTIIAVTLMITFIATKVIMLHVRHNPSMSMSVIPEAYDSTFKFNFKEQNFNIAIAVVDFQSREPKDDPEYVRWLPQLMTSIDGVKTSTPLKFHKCTDEDFAKFYKP